VKRHPKLDQKDLRIRGTPAEEKEGEGTSEEEASLLEVVGGQHLAFFLPSQRGGSWGERKTNLRAVNRTKIALPPLCPVRGKEDTSEEAAIWFHVNRS